MPGKGDVFWSHTVSNIHMSAVGTDVERGLVVPSFLGLVGVRWGDTDQAWSSEASSALLLPGSADFVPFIS